MSHSGELYNIIQLQNKRLQFIEKKIKKLEEKNEEQSNLICLIRNLIDKDVSQLDDAPLFKIDYLKDIFSEKDLDITQFYTKKVNDNNETEDEIIPIYLFDT